LRCATGALLVACALLVPANAARAAAAADDAPAPLRKATIESTLRDQLRTASSSQPIRVVMQFDNAQRIDALPAAPIHRNDHNATAAASLTPAQINELAARPGTVRIATDRRVHAMLDTARAGFGVDKAVTDFGVNGNASGGDPKTYSKSDVVVAVLDTGVDALHVDLNGTKVLHFENLATFDSNFPNGCTSHTMGATPPFDDNGHGTHVSSIIAGEGDGQASMRGVAPGAALVVLKVLDCQGDGLGSDIDAALQWVIDNRATWNIRVANLSLGYGFNTDGTDPTDQLVNQATAAGIATFVAAGNDGPVAGSISSPSTAKWAIAVGAMSDPADSGGFPPGFALASFSSRGPTSDNRVKPDFAAAGVDIRAALAGGSHTGYTTMSGTSMATPFAAGVAALVLQANPALIPGGQSCNVNGPNCSDGVLDNTMHDGLADLMRNTAVDFGAAGADNEFGAGRLDAYSAVTSAASASTLGGPTVPCTQTFSGNLASNGATASFAVTVPSTRWPIAATVVAPAWTATNAPQLRLELLAPGGGLVTSSNNGTRQQSVGAALSSAGQYAVRVTAVALNSAAGDYRVTISATAPEIVGGRDCQPAIQLGRPSGPLSLLEGGAPTVNTYTVALTTAPTANVTVTPAPNANETVSPSSLNFNPGNFSTPQLVTVTAVDDLIAEGAQVGLVTHSATSTDAAYNGIAGPTMPVPIADNDVAGIDLSRVAMTLAEENATSDTYTVKLHSQPTSNVSVQLASDGQVSVAPLSLAFDASNWQNPQTATVAAIDDQLVETSPHSGVVRQVVTSADPMYNGLGSANLVASITDNDAHGLRSGGYRMAARDGGIFAFGNAGFAGSTGGQRLNAPIVGMATTPSGAGYWLVASDGGIFGFGDAGFYGSAGGIHLNKPIVGMAATRTGRGYWLVASDGGIFGFGDAGFFGSTGGIRLNKPIVGMAATPSSNGYWLVASDGGIFAFGDATFAGSAGSIRLNAPIIAMTATPSGHGYLLLASDGGIFTYGDAAFFGSTGSMRLNAPVVGFGGTQFGLGYWLVASDGGIFGFGDAQFFGSTGSIRLNQPIIAIGV
jgi:serine protease AprX